jgi:hypothetical protein
MSNSKRILVLHAEMLLMLWGWFVIVVEECLWLMLTSLRSFWTTIVSLSLLCPLSPSHVCCHHTHGWNCIFLFVMVGYMLVILHSLLGIGHASLVNFILWKLTKAPPLMGLGHNSMFLWVCLAECGGVNLAKWDKWVHVYILMLTSRKWDGALFYPQIEFLSWYNVPTLFASEFFGSFFLSLTNYARQLWRKVRAVEKLIASRLTWSWLWKLMINCWMCGEYGESRHGTKFKYCINF